MRYNCYVAVFIGLVLAMPAFSHHSFNAEYDNKKFVTVTGVVKKIEWINPHVAWEIDVKEPDGTVNTWKISNISPLEWRAAHVTRDMVGKIGETVTVQGWLARDGTLHRVCGKTLTLQDGHKINVEGSF